MGNTRLTSRLYIPGNIGPLICIALSLCMGTLFVVYWDVYFTSDYAMIGLMAKRILEFGDQEIYVWGVGYQGILLESNLVALMFRLFGVNQYTLLLAPFAVFQLLVLLFYRFIRTAAGKSIASLTTIFFLLSTPYLYGKVLRPQPNYGETYVFGVALFLLYIGLLREWRACRGRPRIKFHLMLAAAGFISGFGIYTYGQIYFFLGAIAVHCVILAVRAFREKRVSGMWHDVRANLKTLLSGMLAFTVPLIAGLSPVIYYVYLKKWRIYTWGTEVQFDPGRLLTNTRICVAAFMRFHNLSPLSIWRMVPGLIISGAMAWTLRQCIRRRGTGSVFGNDDFFARSAREILCIFPFMVTAGFVASKAVADVNMIRYFLPILFFSSFSLGFTAVDLFSRSRQTISRVFVSIAVMCVLASNSVAFCRIFSLSDNGRLFRDIIEVMDRSGISRGYGQYWFCYVPTFLTNERIVLEPVSSNYCPFYAKQVKKEDRIVYVDSRPSEVPFSGDTITIKDVRYLREKTIAVDGSRASFDQKREFERQVRREGVYIHIVKRIEVK